MSLRPRICPDCKHSTDHEFACRHHPAELHQDCDLPGDDHHRHCHRLVLDTKTGTAAFCPCVYVPEPPTFLAKTPRAHLEGSS